MNRRVVVVLAVAGGFAGCIDWAGAEEEFCRENPTAAGCEAFLDAGTGGGGGVGGGTGGGGVGGGTGGGGGVGGGTGGGGVGGGTGG
ncbi:MAG: galactose oxidase, partial [Myxococcales bacterium]|nr:galactose oxidase [Myxococcales bacterium]